MSDIHLDSSVLVTLQDVMEDEYPVLLDTFLVDSEERLLILHQAEQAADALALQLAAHSFKGSCSNMGALILAGREIQPSGIPRMIQGIVLVCLIASDFFLRYRIVITRREEE